MPFYPFWGAGSPTKIDVQKKVDTLILTSLLEDLAKGIKDLGLANPSVQPALVSLSREGLFVSVSRGTDRNFIPENEESDRQPAGEGFPFFSEACQSLTTALFKLPIEAHIHLFSEIRPRILV